MRAKLKFGERELNELLRKEAAQNSYAFESEVEWSATGSDEDYVIEAEVDVRPMTHDERAAVLKDARPLDERIAERVSEELAATLAQGQGDRDDAFVDGLSSQLELFALVVREQVEELFGEQITKLQAHEGGEDLDEWANILIGKLDRIKEGQVILAAKIEGRNHSPRPRPSNDFTHGDVATIPGFPDPEKQNGAAEAIQHEALGDQPDEYESLSEEEVISRRRLDRVRAEIAADEAALEAKAAAAGRPNRGQMYTESSEFPEDMKVKE